MFTPGAEMSGLTWPKPCTGPLELKPASSPTKLEPRFGFKRTGYEEIAPFAGSVVLLPPGIRLSRYCPSAGKIFAAGIVALTAVGFCAVETKMTATAPAAAPLFATWPNNVAGKVGFVSFTRAIRPLASPAQSATLCPLLTQTQYCASEVCGGPGGPALFVR